MKKASVLFIIIVICGGVASFKVQSWNNETPVYDVIKSLGGQVQLHEIKLNTELIEKGKQLVHNGFTTDENGKKTSIQSKFFVCTDCHNTGRENPNLTVFDPEKRLAFAAKNNIPFLQATTFFGIVNRENWYNDDYQIKYGDRVLNSRDTLINAIQLCATECSQGRAFEDWEIKAVLNYFWSLQLKLGDLNLTKDDWSALKGKMHNQGKLKLLKTKYSLASPATFISPMEIEKRNNGKTGDADKGKLIYELSCLHCHGYDKKVTDLKLDHSEFSKSMFRNKLNSNTDIDLYYILRKGTPAHHAYRPYMPHYTKERLSDQQVEDLVAYLTAIE